MKYAAAFASIAIGLAMLAEIHGGDFWILLWPAISFSVGWRQRMCSNHRAGWASGQRAESRSAMS